MSADTILCNLEGEWFPRDQFETDPVHGQVHERPPDPSTPRHTTLGDVIREEGGDTDTGSGGGGGGGGGGDGGWSPSGVYKGIAYEPHR